MSQTHGTENETRQSPSRLEEGRDRLQSAFDTQQRWLNETMAQLGEAQQQLRYWWETQHSCPCGARAEALDTHPHVLTCPTERAGLSKTHAIAEEKYG